MSADPMGLGSADPADPQSMNAYAYVRNSPTTLTDPSGMSLENNNCFYLNDYDWPGAGMSWQIIDDNSPAGFDFVPCSYGSGQYSSGECGAMISPRDVVSQVFP
jgi:hypothetical protein